MADNDSFESGRAPVSGRMPPADAPTAEYPGVGEPRPATGDPSDTPDAGAAPGSAVPPEPVSTAPRGAGPERGLRALFWLLASVGLVLALVFGAQAVGWLPDFKNPFRNETTDRSQPPLLQSIQDLSRFVAAEGNFQVIIDVQQNRQYVPEFLINQRILFIAAGTVEAYVDFANVGQGAIKESADRRSVEITLPAPQLAKPNIDNANSYVYSEQRGLLNRIRDALGGDPNRLQEVYVLAEQRIAEAARASELSKRAEDNTRKMLEGMLRSLGYTTITVKYSAP
jgi:hypothetical protein